jgi:peptidase M28-like protein
MFTELYRGTIAEDIKSKKMAYRSALVVLLSAGRIVSAQTVPQLDSARLIANISALAADSMEGRRIGTPGGARARAFLLREFTRIGLAPARDSFPAPFVAKSRSGELSGVNLVGMIRGTKHADRYLVVSAHYDHLGIRNGVIYNGADDNASGTAAVLAMAQWFKAHPPENSIIFALFDGEESGLLGAKAFVETPPVPIERIIADVNLDMVSRNEKGELYASGASPYPAMKPLLDSIKSIAPVKLMLGHDTGAGESNWIQQSDQGPFDTKKIPFVYFGVEDHADYHKPGDKVGHIEPGFYYRCVQTIAEFVRRLDLKSSN